VATAGSTAWSTAWSAPFEETVVWDRKAILSLGKNRSVSHGAMRGLRKAWPHLTGGRWRRHPRILGIADPTSPDESHWRAGKDVPGRSGAIELPPTLGRSGCDCYRRHRCRVAQQQENYTGGHRNFPVASLSLLRLCGGDQHGRVSTHAS
jgi:hypothetical protein